MYRIDSRRPSVISLVLALSLASLAALGSSGCSGTAQATDSRYILGTTVTITAYGDDEGALQEGIGSAFAAMEGVAAQLDAYDPDSAISVINADPESDYPTPDDALAVFAAIEDLGVGGMYSPRLLAVVRLYDLGGEGSVPTDQELEEALRDLGLDFGGAAKGLAVDRAAEALRDVPGLSAALVTAGSTTAATGSKPDGSQWRIGVEDPRDASSIVAVFEADGDVTVSTSGDYQQYFETDGVRYHHILDPATGKPARGLRSLTVAGPSGLVTDILSTALFVIGPEQATDYAQEHGLALYMVDDEGRAHVVPGPDSLGVHIEEVADPTS